MKSQLKQIEQSEKIANVFPSDHKLDVSFLDVDDRKVVLISQTESHKVGSDGMIGLCFHEYQIKEIAKILKNYKLVSTALSTHDYTTINHENIASTLTLHYHKNTTK